jgi:hypothetical protein
LPDYIKAALLEKSTETEYSLDEEAFSFEDCLLAKRRLST